MVRRNSTNVAFDWRASGGLVLGRTIRGRFGRAVMIAGLAPILTTVLLGTTTLRADLALVADDDLASQAQLQSAAVSHVLDRAAEDVLVLAANPVVRDRTGETTHVLEQLGAYESFEEVTLLHPSGAILAATSYGLSGRWEANAAFRGALTGTPFMTPPLFYPDPKRLVVEFSAPVFRDGDIVAVVVASLNMDRVWRVLDDVSIGETGFYAAFDQHGNVIAHPDKALLLRKLAGYPAATLDDGRGTIDFRTRAGTTLVGRAEPVGSTGWHVAALQDEQEAHALADAIISRTVLVASTVLILSALVAMILAPAVSAPIRNVVNAMNRAAQGDLGHRIERSGLDELDSLADSFNDMAAELDRHRRALQAEIAERTRGEERITYQAYHDALTGLPNRMLLKDRLDVALADARRNGGSLAVMFLDIDRFKLVNDSVGHASGDALLQGVSDRILAVVREGDSLARVGGDEYVLLMPRVLRRGAAIQAAERVQQNLRQPWSAGGRSFIITASIGIAMFPEDGTDAETLLRNADTAMYQAKAAGKDAIRHFSPEMDATVQERVSLEHDLEAALLMERFVLHYQPQVDTETGRVIGIEALLRWQDPRRGLVAPQEFISLAEDTGQIWELGRWVLMDACRQAQAWRRSGIIDRIPVAVNISARQFHDVRITDLVQAVLEATGLPPGQLELEITESAAMRDVEHSVRTLARFKEMGVRVSIDDFGTGYSSLAYLKRFPVDAVKIDRSFVRDIDHDADDKAIVGAIITLAKSLSIGCVAEGVETETQLAFLRERGCPAYQGFLFSRAVPATELAERLAEAARSERHPKRVAAPQTMTRLSVTD